MRRFAPTPPLCAPTLRHCARCASLQTIVEDPDQIELVRQFMQENEYPEGFSLDALIKQAREFARLPPTSSDD
jgi:hypothetical protein